MLGIKVVPEAQVFTSLRLCVCARIDELSHSLQTADRAKEASEAEVERLRESERTLQSVGHAVIRMVSLSSNQFLFLPGPTVHFDLLSSVPVPEQDQQPDAKRLYRQRPQSGYVLPSVGSVSD